ncbi:MAG: hypothetical protein HYY24_05795 [Verrucomicrobia bacterium]|nr:hypothetical protein [Verrucomicrobiota bacterium]
MASNKLPASLEDLSTLAEDAADGAHQLEAAIGLKQNTEAAIRADLIDLTDKKSLYDDAVSDRKDLNTAATVARSNARGFLTTARDVFKKHLGQQASVAWEAPGWSSHSIAVPSTSELILPLLTSVKNYLTKNPARENAPLEVTAAKAGALYTALSDARSALNNHDTLIGDRKRDRDASEENLRTRLRGLIGELGQKIGDMDPRWLTFGLKRPGAPDSPDAVTNTRATPLGGGKVRVQCDPAPRADYYQTWIQVAGVDADFRLADSPAEPDKILDGLNVGATVNLKMRAVNETGPGPFGEIVQTSVG